jgi:ankyrin repeat protein
MKPTTKITNVFYGNFNKSCSLTRLHTTATVFKLMNAHISQMSDRQLWDAVRTAKTSRVLELVKNGVNVNQFDPYERGGYPLWLACSLEHLSTARALIHAGADLNSTNSDGETPILYFFGSEQIRRMLIDAGANLHSRNQLGESILSYTARSNKHDLMFELISRGMDISHRDSYGSTVLHDTASHFKRGKADAKIEMIHTILDLNADINATDHSGNTALHIAASMGFEVSVGVLLERNASIYVTNSKGLTAKDVAWRNNHSEIARMIEGEEREQALQNQRLAIAMALHFRLGDEAPVSELGVDVISNLVSKLMRDQH